MKRPYPRRPSAAMVVALLALFFALGGSVYAAATIDGKSIKKNSEPGNRIVKKSLPGNRLKNGTVTGTQLAGCPGGTLHFAGACWQKSASATALNVPDAEAACVKAGGSLPRALELVQFAKLPGVTLDAGDEWTSDLQVSSLNTYTVDTVAPNGDINIDNPTVDTKKFRCVIPRVN